ncbi:MAG: Hpt domain-containing protein [Oscillospiraceae bacterium]|nr:Hpt domain-containing protein [Oscillospiraceae bacterium]
MSELTERMDTYGADTAATMERFLNDEVMYLKCLHIFSKDSGFTDLSSALEKKDYTEAFESAHMLKGVASNLGLTPLYDKICILVEALRRQDDANTAQQYQNICTEKERMIKILLK